MSFLDPAKKQWAEMRVRERKAFLEELERRLGGARFTKSDAPLEAFAHTVDFDSLPGDLCGTLILSLTESGFSVDTYVQRTERIKKSAQERSSS